MKKIILKLLILIILIFLLVISAEIIRFGNEYLKYLNQFSDKKYNIYSLRPTPFVCIIFMPMIIIFNIYYIFIDIYNIKKSKTNIFKSLNFLFNLVIFVFGIMLIISSSKEIEDFNLWKKDMEEFVNHFDDHYLLKHSYFSFYAYQSISIIVGLILILYVLISLTIWMFNNKEKIKKILNKESISNNSIKSQEDKIKELEAKIEILMNDSNKSNSKNR